MSKIKMCVWVLLSMLVCVNSASAVWTYFNGNVDQDWFTSGNWGSGDPNFTVPTAADYAEISHVDGVIVSSGDAVCTGLYVGNRAVAASSRLEISGGSLTVSSTAMIGPVIPGTISVSGGDVSISGITYLGYDDGDVGTLEITGGKVSTAQLQMGRVAGVTSLVKIYGGTLEVNLDVNGFHYGIAGTQVDIKGAGVLKWLGDHAVAMNWIRDVKGYIYTSEAGKVIGNAVYDDVSGYTTMTVADSPNSGWTNFTGSIGQNWFIKNNWSTYVPTAVSGYPVITIADANSPVISGGDAVCTSLYVGQNIFAATSPDGKLQISSGSLTVGSTVFIGKAPVSGTISMSDGDVSVGGYTYVGYSADATLEITGGRYYSGGQVNIAKVAGTTCIVKLYGGILEIDLAANGLFFGAGDGQLDIKGDGLLKSAGDHVATVNSHINSTGKIYTSEPDGSLTVELAGGYTLAYVAGTYDPSYGDIDGSGMVNLDDLAIMSANWSEWEASSLTNPNPVIFAPHTAAITVDGDLSDWANSSDWATFGAWYEYGLISETKVKYAWNATEKRLYIGIETTEPGFIEIPIAGLMGEPDTDPLAKVESSDKTAYYKLIVDDDTSTVTVDGSTLGRSITGVVAEMYVVNGTTRTFEISTPVYTNWAAGTGEHTLAADTTIYNYINLWADSWAEYYPAADSQSRSDGLNFYFAGAPLMDVGSAIRLIDVFPVDCSDMPDDRGNLADIAGDDCVVDILDLVELAQDWILCTVPGGCQ